MVIPSFLRLDVYTTSRVIVLPFGRIATSVERQAVWHRILSPIDEATTAILPVHLACIRACWDRDPLSSANHPSWEKDTEDGQESPGRTIAAWIYKEILEWVPPSCPDPLIMESLGAMEKSTQSYYQLISDAHRSNRCLRKWSVTSMNFLAMEAVLDYGVIISVDDIKDVHHLLPCGGCSGELMEELGVTSGSDEVCLERSPAPSRGMSPQTSSWALAARHAPGAA
jgi:hypothetical protein